jgi:aspartyl-tRNA(Asn)/glutamyl-tRNA(Gln) amidotransferase subunit C
MKIDREEARRVARLAHLEFDDQGLGRMADEMTAILGYIDQLREADVTSGGGDSSGQATPLRADEPRPPVARELAAANAPSWNDGFFVVPKVIGGES